MSSLLINQYANSRQPSEEYSETRQHKYLHEVGQKVGTQARLQLPYLSANNNAISKLSRELSASNRHLRYLFNEFCRQSYIGGPHLSFEQIARSAEVMSLNKWMLFCKEFDLMRKLSNRDLVLIYRKATNQASSMNIEQFCMALERVKQKSHIISSQLTNNILCLSTHGSVRNRICSMKIRFSGPQVDYWKQLTKTENERIEEDQKQRIYREKKSKENQAVLHQGMFKEHIDLILREKKEQRRQRSWHIPNHSAVEQKIPKHNTQSAKPERQKKYRKSGQVEVLNPERNHSRRSKSIFGNYSRIFQARRATTTSVNSNKISDPNREETNAPESEKAAMVLAGQQEMAAVQQPYQQGNLFIKQASGIFDGQGFQMNYPDDKIEVDSDAQSDQILKDHYRNENKINLRPFLGGKIISKASEEVDRDDNDTNFMITRYT